MSRYHQWKNLAQAGDTVFVTTGVLGFLPVFLRRKVREALVWSLCDDHDHYGAILHAFVVLPDHIHVLTSLPDARSVAWFVQRIKTNSAKRVRPLLTAAEERQLARHRHRATQVLWDRGFRSVPIDDERSFWQKVDYIHANPVNRGLCMEAPDYRWSSACLFEKGAWSEARGVARAWLTHPAALMQGW